MSAKILDGKKLSGEIAEKLKLKVSKLKVKPSLAIIQVGDLPQSSSYIERKKNYGANIGATVHHIMLPEKVSEKKILELITELNLRKDIHGIIVQLPIPKNLNTPKILEAIDPMKDVDGLHSHNAFLMYEGSIGNTNGKDIPRGLAPATAKGIVTLLKANSVDLVGKKVLVIGRSLLVGKPTVMLMLGENATVTIAHNYTNDLDKLCKEHDIIVVAVGKAGLIGKKALKKGHIVVDVGTNSVGGPKTLEEISKKKLVGDVVFDEAIKIVSAISPVPGGVGPMTVASLFENLLDAHAMQKNSR